ncbi:protein kinase [Corallococcus exercitus]|uniref:Protein kinase n=1 Tax=Corallococcus exercitus TaxID=2316736 RepID=A0A7Y4NW20_9BACT|nr:bifunctional serine/threonine-protein kinase/formylglycine-generating enzyme family protein [Corallococcus exercitus]NOK37928.1 protein kinase [Corallococcus exercitus]
MALSKRVSVGPGTPDCLSDQLLADLIDGRLPPEDLALAHRHAVGCASCRVLLATVARGGLVLPSLPPSEAGTPTADVAESGVSWTPPAAFDEFQLGPLLGRGGMGVVYLAQDVSLGRPVAVKFIAGTRPGSEARARFETEARAIARLQHPNVVTVFRIGTVEGHPYIVSEYISGTSLAKLPRPLPWLRVLHLGLGLARGLAAAHQQGVLHRDLKPSNALVTDDGVVKLLDFGLAEHFDPAAAMDASSSRALAGTPRYMAPELFRGTSASPRSDLFSLGRTLQELCSGGGASGPPHATGTEPDPEFEALIQRCLASDPAERPASAEQLCASLERLVQLYTATPLAEGNPYRGLAPFEAEHQGLFFGRDADIRAVIERLRRQPLVLVAGDSGVGKSSLCLAGVLPRMSAGALAEGRELTSVTLWPGARPLQALATALAPRLGLREADVSDALLSRRDWLGATLREAYPASPGLLLFVDQLEELLTQAEPAQAARFAQLLGELALPSPGVRVLLAVRGDFLTGVSALPGLGGEAERALYILRPMTPTGVRDAIVGPARSHGVGFESEGFIQSLVDSATHGEGSLPLLQFALAELWERRDPAQRHITHRALEAMGGVAGALSRHADGVLDRLDPDARQAARRLLLQLVTVEGTRRELDEAVLLPEQDASSRTALRALTEGRLLHARTVGGQARYVINHDSLIDRWDTLRNWRDDDIGHRAVRHRVEAASAEWERLSHAREALWRQRQVDEARPLDPSMLGTRERAFLVASERALRRQRWGRYLAVLLVVLALAAVYGGLRLQTYLEDQRFIADQVSAARESFTTGRTLGAQARALREDALALFDGRVTAAPGSSASPHDPWSLPEAKWAQALDLRDQADQAHAHTVESLERALERERDQREAHPLLAEVLYERMLLAEAFQQQESAAELRRRLERLVDGKASGAWRARLSAPAELAVVTEPPGASVDLGRYVSDGHGQQRLDALPALGRAPISRVLLPAGSYLLHITRPGHAPLSVPLLLARGGRERVQLTLPATLPSGYVYVPPGCFLLGSGDPEPMRGFLRASPLHRVCLGTGYLIGRTEVTFGDWLLYLNDLPQSAAARHVLEEPRFTVPKAITLRHQAGRGWVFSFHVSGDEVLSVGEKESFRYPGRSQRRAADWRRLPLSGVSTEDLAGYFYWLDRTGRLPGARLCSEHEWEYAARGADGRAFPQGDRLKASDANIDTTYAREPSAFGPDMVGSYPGSVSPFGLQDMAGNAFELTRAVTADLGRIVLKGGGWYYDAIGAHGANRQAGDPTLRDVTLGVRVCASFSPQEPRSQAVPEE